MPQYDTDSIITNTISNPTTSFSIYEVWIIISVLLAVIGGIFLFNTYFYKDKAKEYSGLKKVLYDFVNFKFTIIEPLFKVLYLIIAITLTLSSLSLITTNFFKFIGVLVFGNILVRLIFELLLLILKLFKDVSEINSKLKSDKPKQLEKLLPRKNIKKVKEPEDI